VAAAFLASRCPFTAGIRAGRGWPSRAGVGEDVQPGQIANSVHQLERIFSNIASGFCSEAAMSPRPRSCRGASLRASWAKRMASRGRWQALHPRFSDHIRQPCCKLRCRCGIGARFGWRWACMTGSRPPRLESNRTDPQARQVGHQPQDAHRRTIPQPGRPREGPRGPSWCRSHGRSARTR